MKLSTRLSLAERLFHQWRQGCFRALLDLGFYDVDFKYDRAVGDIYAVLKYDGVTFKIR